MGSAFRDLVLIVNPWPEKKSGIYQINCKNVYIGKTKRDSETRVKEHFRNIKNEEIEKSEVAEHLWKEKHVVDHKPVLLKQASNKQGKYPYNKKQRLCYKFLNPTSRSFN